MIVTGWSRIVIGRYTNSVFSSTIPRGELTGRGMCHSEPYPRSCRISSMYLRVTASHQPFTLSSSPELGYVHM